MRLEHYDQPGSRDQGQVDISDLAHLNVSLNRGKKSVTSFSVFKYQTLSVNLIHLLTRMPSARALKAPIVLYQTDSTLHCYHSIRHR